MFTQITVQYSKSCSNTRTKRQQQLPLALWNSNPLLLQFITFADLFKLYRQRCKLCGFGVAVYHIAVQLWC